MVLVARDLKVQYERSMLGLGWAIAVPLLQLITYSLVFRRLLAVQVPNYPSFVFVGVLVWGWFQTSLTQSAGLITGSKSLVLQPRFPLTLLPHVTVGVRLFHFLVALPLLFSLLWWEGLRPAWSWCAIPALLAIQYILTVGLAYPLASLNVVVRDTQHVVGVILQLVIFVTPVFYSHRSIPDHLQVWWHLNPMAGLIGAWRQVLLEGRWPDPWGLLAILLVGAALLVLGRRAFVAQSHRFVEEI